MTFKIIVIIWYKNFFFPCPRLYRSRIDRTFGNRLFNVKFLRQLIEFSLVIFDHQRRRLLFVRLFFLLTLEYQKFLFAFYLNCRTAMLVFILLLVGDDNDHEARRFFILPRNWAFTIVYEPCLEIIKVRSLIIPLIFLCDFLQRVVRVWWWIRTAFVFFLCFLNIWTYLFLLWSLLFGFPNRCGLRGCRIKDDRLFLLKL